MPGLSTLHLQQCLDRLGAGDEAALAEILDEAGQRLTQLARGMLNRYPRLRRWEESDDIYQGAMLRLCQALRSVTPATPRDFYRLAAAQIRRQLIDLARHYYGPVGPGTCHASWAPGTANHSTAGALPYEPTDTNDEPAQLAAWSEFHAQVEMLPEEEREVFDLVWYQGLTHTQAAAILEISTRTVKRRWQAACLRLHEALGDRLPTF